MVEEYSPLVSQMLITTIQIKFHKFLSIKEKMDGGDPPVV
jgi:hypothetical protein